jgi:hypothetical protein
MLQLGEQAFFVYALCDFSMTHGSDVTNLVLEVTALPHLAIERERAFPLFVKYASH